MLTTREITDLLGAAPSGMQHGKVQYLANRENRPTVRSTKAQRDLLNSLAAQQPTQVATYNHPEVAADRPRREPGPLTPIEQTWLSRLPTDPTQIPHADAKVLASMAESIPAMEHPTDRRVVDQVWQPVKEMHDRKEAETAVRNAEQPLPPVPAAALNALADAVLAQHDQLQPHEAVARANQLLTDTLQRRKTNRDRALLDARAQLAAVKDAAAKRTEVIAS